MCINIILMSNTQTTLDHVKYYTCCYHEQVTFDLDSAPEFSRILNSKFWLKYFWELHPCFLGNPTVWIADLSQTLDLGTCT